MSDLKPFHKLAWRNLLQLIREIRPLRLSRSQVWARELERACAENRARKERV